MILEASREPSHLCLQLYIFDPSFSKSNFDWLSILTYFTIYFIQLLSTLSELNLESKKLLELISGTWIGSSTKCSNYRIIYLGSHHPWNNFASQSPYQRRAVKFQIYFETYSVHYVLCSANSTSKLSQTINTKTDDSNKFIGRWDFKLFRRWNDSNYSLFEAIKTETVFKLWLDKANKLECKKYCVFLLWR